MTKREQQHLDRMRQRRDYLTLRIRIKKAMNWENDYDRDERDALKWAIGRLEAAERKR